MKNNRLIIRLLMVVTLLVTLTGVYRTTLNRATRSEQTSEPLADAEAPQPVAPSVTPTPTAATSASTATPEIEAFREWLKRFEALPETEKENALAEGSALAKARRPVMVDLIRHNPRAALNEALPLDEWLALPAEIKAQVEKPFSESVTYNVYPVCKSPNQLTSNELPEVRPPAIRVRFSDGSAAQAFVYGGKNAVSSKDALPTQGIALDGVAALRDGVFQELSSKEATAAAGAFPTGQPDPARSFVTGKPVTGEPVVALAGGRRFTFASSEELQSFDRAIAKLDAKPGPHAGSRAIFELPYRLNATGSNFDSYAFDFSAAESIAMAAATNWTTTKKKVFLIRVVISGTSATTLPSQSELQTVINGTSTTGTAANSIYQFSYGKTWAEATISSGTYQLTKTADYYLNSGSSNLEDEMLEDARTIFRNQKSANVLDSAINIGSGSLTVTDTGSSSDSNMLGDYDVVGIQFPEMSFGSGPGITSGGWAGLASVGGRNLWLQGYPDAATYKTTLVHEMGHIYGLAHSSFWQTSDNSVVGSGTLEEYGDLYDVMGNGNAPQDHFHPQAKQRLSWIDDTQWADASAQGSGLYRIYQIDSSLTTGSLRGVRLTKGTSTAAAESEYYWVGYRPTHTESQHFTQGAYLLWERFPSVNSGDRSMLLDTTPLTSGTSKSGKADAPVDVGRTYSDSSAKVHITPVGYGDAGGSGNKYLDVQINVGTLTTGSYTASILSSGSVNARTTTTFTASTTLSSSTALAYYWEAGDGTVFGGSGTSASTFPYSYTAGGTYTVKLTVSDMKGSTASGSLSVNVSDPAQNFSKRILTSGTSTFTGDITAVAASDTLLVAVGYKPSGAKSGNLIRTSPDGITWTERSVAEATLNLYFECVTWDGTRFIAGGQDYSDSAGWYGVLYTSTDGISWSRVYSSTHDLTVIRSVSAGNGVIIAVGDSGTVLRSSNGGTTWSAISGIPLISSGSMSCRGIAFGGGTFALTARSQALSTGSGAVCISTDGGLSWSNQTSGAGFPSTSEDFQKIAYLNGKFITSGWFSGLKTGTFSSGSLYFSTTRSDYDLTTVIGYNSGLYFASGNTLSQDSGDTTYTPVNLYSTDGSNWKTSTPQAGMTNQLDGVFFNNRLISVGSLGAIYQSDSLSPNNHAPTITSLVAQTSRYARSPITLSVAATDADGDSLSYRWDAGDGIHSGTSSVFTTTYSAGGTYNVVVTVNDGKGGSVSSSTSLVVSDSATKFTSRTSGTTETLNGIACSGSLVVAVGDHGKVPTSMDGTTWTDRTISSATNLYLNSVTWDGTRFVAVGLDYPSGSTGWVGVIYTSIDGTTWNKRYTSSGSTSSINAFRSVASSGGTLFVGGDVGRLLRSTDASNWSAVPSSTLAIPGTHSVTGLAYGAGVFIATAHKYYDPDNTGSVFTSGKGKVYTTTDGSTWSDTTAGAGLSDSTDLNGIAFLNDRFVGSGWYSKLRVSTDNGNTFSSTRSDYELTPALAYGRGVYLAAGLNQSDNNTKIHALSTDGVNWTQSAAPTGVVSENAATFFNNTFLVVGGSGQIWQSDPVTTSGTLEILTQPTALTVNSGGSATFSVVAAGSGTLTYTWKKTGSDSTLGTGSLFTIASASTTDAGFYAVTISDSGTGTSLTSNSVLLTVIAATVSSEAIVSTQPASSVSLVQGSDATLAITLTAPSASVTQTAYTLYSGTTALSVTGTISSGTTAYIPLKSLTTAGSYSVQFTRTYNSGSVTTGSSNAFAVNFTTWDSALGTYQALLANGSAATTALGDTSVYRGLLTLTVGRSGTTSGRLLYNEATPLTGGSSGQRVYAPITRTFAGRFVPKAGTPSTMTFTPKLGTTAQSLREGLTLEMDLSSSPKTLTATLSDFVSVTGGTCVSSANSIVKSPTELVTGSLTGVAGKYLVSANLGDTAANSEPQGYIQSQVTSSARVFWGSRFTGYTGTGSGYLNTATVTQPSFALYESRLSSTSKVYNSTSLLGAMSFASSGGSLWATALGSGALPNALEKQGSYVTLTSGSIAYNQSLFSSGSNSTGVKHISFSNHDTARWSGATYTGLPSFLPSTQALNLSVVNPQTTGSLTYKWTVTVSSTGVVRAVSNTATDGTDSPKLSLSLNRTTGLWSGVYLSLGSRKTLVGTTIDTGTGSGRAAVGWTEVGTAPNLISGTWTLSK